MARAGNLEANHKPQTRDQVSRGREGRTRCHKLNVLFVFSGQRSEVTGDWSESAHVWGPGVVAEC